MSRTPSSLSAGIVALATAAVTLAGVLLVGLAGAQMRAVDTRGHAIACESLGRGGDATLAGRATVPGCRFDEF
jgi:hypothetical protein